HEANQSLHLQNVQAAQPRRVDGASGFVLVAVLAADALIAARTECPTAVFGGRTIARQDHGAHVARGARVLEGGVELVHGLRTKRIANLGAVEGHANGSELTGAMIGDIFERKSRYRVP